MIPPELLALAEAPPEFVACTVPEHTGHNFVTHAQFSRNQQKTYWLLLGPLNEGVYTLKSMEEADKLVERIACARKTDSDWLRLRRFSSRHAPNGRMSWFGGKDTVFIATGECSSHPTACVHGCPTHERQVVAETTQPQPKNKKRDVVKKEPMVKEEAEVSAGMVKQEVLTPAVKREAAGTATKRKAEMQSPATIPKTPAKGGTRRLPHARKAPTDDDARSVGSDFFFLPDSPSPAAGKGKASPERTGAAAATVENAPPSRATSPTISTVSSVSASSVAASKADTKGKGRAVSHAPGEGEPSSSAVMEGTPNTTLGAGKATDTTPARGATDRAREAPVSGISRASAAMAAPPAATSSISRAPPAIAGPSAPASSISRVGRDGGPSCSRGPSHAGIFYVSARGAVHHSRDQAFLDIDVGPIQPVVGYDAAMSYPDKLVLGQNGATSGEEMDLGA
ncbi:hypothetical protein C8F04DRAFT_1186405 [Mycena alexandri]|uniref:Uncharacterized protein n=1 Tax=Mycena alexandri TaxID=1745969 RepID=A0AAD6SSF3_9AGAR|nr:hypothetical protein C8F04DRAFT_1186405 [Mycena alexandri]